MNAHVKMLVGVVTGALAGFAWRLLPGDGRWLGLFIEYVAQPVGQIFLRLLFMLIVPLLFSALVIGVCGLELKSVGRIGLRTLGYTVVVSTIAVLIGLVLVNVLQPGAGLPDELRALAKQTALVQAVPKPPDTKVVTQIVQMVPDNVLRAAASGDMIGLIVFALLFAVALSFVETQASKRLLEVIEGLYDVMMKMIDGVLKLAPIGVAALLFTMAARLGLGVMKQLAAYVGVVLLGLSIHMFGVYSLSVRFLGGRSPVRFFADSRLAIVTAFATASSSATLPTAIKVAEENLKLPTHVSRFVLTAGSAMNQNGTALFEGVTVLFLAQLFGVELSLTQQFVVMVICILGGIGTAGVPAGSLPVVAMILGMFGIPPEGLGLVLGIDRFLDMCRTTLNVTGDLAAAVYVAKGAASSASSEPTQS
ncbi:MAG: dicarboxylate/amino acid:cation symporter [Polyangiaceae bacterium]|nr:dicarboxylate/amino acid:cation symporter [Polyangiaceae bacterium]